MNKLITVSIFLTILISMMSLSFESTPEKSRINTDSLEAAKQMFVDEVMITIKGREELNSDSVYQNVQILKEMPAGNLLNVMNKGFSKALGVGCDHCHNTQNFASEEIPAKQITREMMKMSGQIREILSNIKEIESENPSVSCATCHRGSIIPATKVD